MKRRFIISVFVVFLALLMSCRNGSGERTLPNIREDGLVISGLSEDKWTYFSFEKGETVGQSTFLSEEEDAIWAARKDWDFAICGDYLKTNGGTSGSGMGGVLRDQEHNFVTLEEAPSEGYLQDKEKRVLK